MLPKLRKRPWWEREFWPELFGAAPGIGAAVVAACKTVDDPHQWLFWVSVACGVLVCVGAIVKCVRGHAKDKTADELASPSDLAGCLCVIQAAALHAAKLEFTEKNRNAMRLTIHAIEGDEVVQLVNYVGATGGKPGRRRSARSGLLGKIATGRMKCAVMHRSSTAVDEDYRRQLRVDYSMTDSEIRELSHDKLSFMAVAILGDEDVPIGVVYLDSTLLQFFEPEPVQEAIVIACSGLAEYVHLRYSK